jgi:hypothetical protein
MKLSPLICGVWLFACVSSWASDQAPRLLEIMDGGGRLIFDLNTVKIIEPGRFSIIESKIDDPDRMMFRLKTLAALRPYCERPDGQYPAPANFLALGEPNVPVRAIEVKSGPFGDTILKMVSWTYPYRQLGPAPASVRCKSSNPNRTDVDLLLADVAQIATGVQSRILYDCKRALWAALANNDEEDLTTVKTAPVQKGTQTFTNYLSICSTVTHEKPYVPQ